jgi:hypothetical protein
MSNCGGSGGIIGTSGCVWIRTRVGLAQLIARCDGLVDLRLEIRALGDAGAVAADAAEAGQLAASVEAIGCGLARLLFALQSHREQQREGELARASRSEQDQRVRQTACSDRCAKALDDGLVADEFVECLRERHDFSLPLPSQ